MDTAGLVVVGLDTRKLFNSKIINTNFQVRNFEAADASGVNAIALAAFSEYQAEY